LSEFRFAGRSFRLESPEGSEPLGADYDEKADVLYLWRGDAPVEAISVPTDDGPIVRVDPTTGELVGVTLLDFRACWSTKTRIELHLPAVGRSEGDVPAAAREERRELVLA
jgi:Protein of unknown function (DUF2283)